MIFREGSTLYRDQCKVVTTNVTTTEEEENGGEGEDDDIPNVADTVLNTGFVSFGVSLSVLASLLIMCQVNNRRKQLQQEFGPQSKDLAPAADSEHASSHVEHDVGFVLGGTNQNGRVEEEEHVGSISSVM